MYPAIQSQHTPNKFHNTFYVAAMKLVPNPSDPWTTPFGPQTFGPHGQKVKLYKYQKKCSQIYSQTHKQFFPALLDPPFLRYNNCWRS